MRLHFVYSTAPGRATEDITYGVFAKTINRSPWVRMTFLTRPPRGWAHSWFPRGEHHSRHLVAICRAGQVGAGAAKWREQSLPLCNANWPIHKSHRSNPPQRQCSWHEPQTHTTNCSKSHRDQSVSTQRSATQSRLLGRPPVARAGVCAQSPASCGRPCTLGLALWRRLTHAAQMFPVTESPGNNCVKTHALSKACLECDQMVWGYCLITGQLETQPCFLLSELLGLASLMGHDSNNGGCSEGFL